VSLAAGFLLGHAPGKVVVDLVVEIGLDFALEFGVVGGPAKKTA
jgi:hypothetical protein